MDTDEARKQIRETILAIRKVFKNKDWRVWADAWLAGSDQSSESAMAMAGAIAHMSSTTIRSDQRVSAGDVALTASFVEDLVQGHYKGDLPEWLAAQIAQGYEKSKKM